MTVGRAAVRPQQWWNHKIPPLLAAAALVIGASDRTDDWAEIRSLVLFLLASIGVAAFGHVVNDLADLGPDRAAGKRNVLALVGAPARVGLVVGTLVVGLVPFRWLSPGPLTLGLLAAEVLLLVAYSVPPVRLKERGVLGLLADASYAYVLPLALAMSVFSGLPGGPDIGPVVWVPVLVWALLSGIRGILWHQVLDVDNDRRAGVRTLVVRTGADRAERLAASLCLVEVVVLAVAVCAVGVTASEPWLMVFGAAYLVWRLFQVTWLWHDDLLARARHDRPARLRLVGFVLVNEFVEKWLPTAALVAVAIGHPAWWVVVAVYLLLFDNAVAEFISRDAHGLPDAVERFALERRVRRSITTAAEQRAAGLAHGPDPVTDEVRAGRRWVFVACGPAMHVQTLHTGLRNLRPVTSLEIWVVTDSRRNEVPVDASLADHVVDVVTPDHLDDHQASIWLKTGLHRHLPEGEWCYLDTDVIAVAPGVEEVFEHRAGPVAFASDLTIAANQVDRFSPWAMTCDCSGQGDDHSCEHLREELRRRLDLEVPGDWVHWNGGVFVFGPDSTEVMDTWNRIAVESFDWPEWRTRDQGALIATVWLYGLQDIPRLPSEFNFIADLGNSDLCLDPERGWALHPAGPWLRPRFMHLYTSRLEDPDWDISRDVEVPVIRQSTQRRVHFRYETWREKVKIRFQLLGIRARRLPSRLTPARVSASLRRRLGRPAADQPVERTSDGVKLP